MKIISAGKSDVGLERKDNEDGFLINDDIELYAVADGLGGHAGGDVASCLCLEVLERMIAGSVKKEGDSSEKSSVNLLTNVINRANHEILEKMRVERSLEGMGSTITALWVRSSYTIIANVGDSRAYVLRDGVLAQITEDHSWVQEQVRKGYMSAREAEVHPHKNVLTRCLGMKDGLDVDIFQREILTGDKYLLCSDGLTNMVNDDEIKETLGLMSPAESAGQLIKTANLHGGRDNITVVVLEIV